MTDTGSPPIYSKYRALEGNGNSTHPPTLYDKPKSSAQVESFVRQQVVSQNSGGLKPGGSRVCRLVIRFTPEEHETIVRQAEITRMTISQYARLVLLKRPYLDPERHSELRKANFGLLKIEVNLNQITKRFNSGQTTPAELDALLAILMRPLKAAMEAVREAMMLGRTTKYEDE